jgi:hypothetical protein
LRFLGFPDDEDEREIDHGTQRGLGTGMDIAPGELLLV